MKLLKEIQGKFLKPKITPEQIFKQRKELIITWYQHATKAKVEGILALEAEVYDYDTEQMLVQRVYKKAINMLIYWETQENIQKYIAYERTLLLTQKRKEISELQDLYLVESILSVLAKNDAGRYFSYMKKNAEAGWFLDKKMIQEIENEILQKLISEKEQKWLYPIFSHPQISEITQVSDQIFKTLHSLSTQKVHEFLRESSSDGIVLLLWISSKENQEFLFSHCSQRLVQMLRDDMNMSFYSIPSLSYGTLSEVNFDMIQENLSVLQELLFKIWHSEKNNMI